MSSCVFHIFLMMTIFSALFVHARTHAACVQCWAWNPGRALAVLGKHSATELHHQPHQSFYDPDNQGEKSDLGEDLVKPPLRSLHVPQNL